jgi:membrane protein DedA with SNARE-associated domain
MVNAQWKTALALGSRAFAFPLAFIHIPNLQDVQNLMSTWGYPVLFGLLFSCGLGLPLPEDIPLLLAGYFVAIGKMKLCYAALCAWCGILGGDCMLYSAGRRWGMGITKVPLVGHLVTAKRIQYAERLFQKYGGWVVGFGRMIAIVRGAMVVAAGTIRYNIFYFLIADGVGAIFSGGLFMAIGYWAGKKLGDLEEIRKKVEHYQMRVLIGAAVLILLILCWKWLRKKLKAPVIDKAMGGVVHTVEKKEHPPDSKPAKIEDSRETPAANTPEVEKKESPSDPSLSQPDVPEKPMASEPIGKSGG